MDYIPKKLLVPIIAIVLGIIFTVSLMPAIGEAFNHMMYNLKNWNGPTIAPR